MDMNRALGQAIRRRRTAVPFTQPQLAEAAGIDQGSLSRIERGREEPPNEKLDRIAAALGVKVSTLWLEAEGYSDMAAEPETTYKAAGIRYVPLISWVQAGEWAEAVDSFARGTGTDLVPTSVNASPRSYALRVRGPSMTNPTGARSFPDGTTIIVDPTRPAENGALVIVRLENEDEATFKQLVVEGSQKWLKPLNPQFPVMPLNRPATFCGVVVSIAETEV